MIRATSLDRSDDSGRRPTKRLRSSSFLSADDGYCDVVDNDNDSPILVNSDSPSPPNLLPEIWAQVMDFLPYQSVLRSAAASRTMLREAIPLVTMLHVDRPAQLHASVAYRYREVKDVYIYSLVNFLDRPDDEDVYECVLDEDTALRAVPFLCHFPRLERAFLGGRRPDGGEVEGFVPLRHSLDEDRDRMRNLIQTFSGAFRAGALARNLWVLGLRCPRSHRHTNFHRESSCLVCRNACKSFPLEIVADFECEGSSEKHIDVLTRYGRPDDRTEQIYGLDVCLRREKIEAIIKERPGGSDFLFSEARFLNLLGMGTRHVVVPDEGKELYVVKYDEIELGEIKRFVDEATLDVKKLSPEAVTGAIKRSFAADVRGPLPPSGQCYLSETSFYALKNMGLPIDEASFLNVDEWEGKKHQGIEARCQFFYNWRFS